MVNKNVLISVFDKTNLENITKFLNKKKYTIYSTGGSSKYLKKIHIPHIQISKYTKQKEILGGRVKTLHPKIFGGILAKNTKQHQRELNEEKIINFDLIIVNLYPFEETVKNNKKKDEIIEMIDIGGHSIIRAAIKNYKKTVIITDPLDYQGFIKKAITYYNKALKAGALGGKILGAGGGGFLLLYVQKNKQKKVIKALSELFLLDFNFDTSGTRITYYDNNP